MYKLVQIIQNHIYLKIIMHLVEQYILFKFLHNVKHVLNQERDIIIHVILKKNKTRYKIKYFCLFKNFQCFWIFFYYKKNLKNKTTKKRNKTCLQKIERIKLGTSKQHSL